MFNNFPDRQDRYRADDHNRPLTKGLGPVSDFVNETPLWTSSQTDGNHLFNRNQLTFPFFILFIIFLGFIFKSSPTLNFKETGHEPSQPVQTTVRSCRMPIYVLNYLKQDEWPLPSDRLRISGS